MQESPLISLQNASIAVGPKVLLPTITWHLNPGEHWVISGPCGSGKTIFAEFLANKHRLAEGSRNYSLYPSLPLSEQLKTGLRLISFTDTGDLFLNYRDINYYQQRFNAFDAEGHLTMEEYFEKEREEIEKYRDLLEGIGIYHLLKVERIKLSSGQTRKMLLTKVLMSQPKVLVLDNAYIGLDTLSRKVLNQVLDGLVYTREISLILAGHHRELPQCINKRLFIDKNHRVEETPLEHPAPRSFLPIDSKKIESIQAYFHSPSYLENCDEVIRMDQVHIQYGGKSILGPLDWRVKPGEKWAVY
ncbi:MAG: ATP-binding cassette domain-containing protein, partial [Bacteroidota bacterium]